MTMIIMDSSEETTIVNPELEETLDDIGEEGCEVRVNIEHGCFYVCPREDYEYSLSPCLPSQEDLENWALENIDEILEKYRDFLVFHEGG